MNQVDDGHDVSLRLNAGDGTFGAPVRYAAGYFPSSLALGDMTDDGAMDLAVTNIWDHSVSVFVNTCPLRCPADLNGSGDVGFEGLTALRSNWGPCIACPADMNGTGDDWVGFDDLAMLLGAWGPC